MQRQPLIATSPTYFQHAYAQQAAHPQYHDPNFASPGYRQLQLPLQQQQQQYQLSTDQLALASGFHAPNFRTPNGLPLRAHTHPLLQHPVMPFQDDELAEFQKLSNDWQPEMKGPLVGPREPSTIIAAQYASADPVFQAKAAALPQKYSHYRSVRGDGSCGWRAIAFGYFETLIHLGDNNKFLEEEARLRSMSNVMTTAGYAYHQYEEFEEVFLDTLRAVRDAVLAGTADDTLSAAFNEEGTQNYIITYMRTLTSAWMKTRSEEYAPWLLGTTVEAFCRTSVDAMYSQIEHVSITALKDALLAGAGIALEIFCLDRTEGNEVNMHRVDPNGISIGTIRLLYRPDHYDLLYKFEDIPVITTFFQLSSNPYHEPAHELGFGDFMMNMPGGTYVPPHQAWMSGSSFCDTDFFSNPTPVQHCVKPTIATPAPQPQMQVQAVRPTYAPTTPVHLVAPPTQMPQELAIRTVGFTHPSFEQYSMSQFRPSRYERAPFVLSTSSISCQTSQFRDSHFNTAHFRNPDFQPEEWRPDGEYVTICGKAPRHKVGR